MKILTMKLLYGLSQNRIILAFALFLAIHSIIYIALFIPKRSVTWDFAHYYLASKVFLEGKNVYQTDLVPLYAQNGFVLEGGPSRVIGPHPPSFYFFFAPLAKLKRNQAYIIWVIVEIISLCSILCMTKILLNDRLSFRGWFFLCVAAISSVWVYGNFWYSQVSLILAALILLGFAMDQAGYRTLACLIIAIAGLLKIFPFLLLPWFFARGNTVKNRVYRSSVIFGLIFFVIFVTGLENWGDFFRFSLNSGTADSINRTFNYSLPSFIINLGYAPFNFSPPVFYAHLWTTIGIMMGLALIGLCYLISFMTNDNHEITFSLICLGILMGFVRTWGHYFVIIIFPISVAFARSYSSSSPIRFISLIVLYCILNLHLPIESRLFQSHFYFWIFVNYLPLYGVIGLFIFFLNELRPSLIKHFIKATN